MRDILDRLRVDAGQLTIAGLIQEREVAASEIEHLRERLKHEVAKQSSKRRTPDDQHLLRNAKPSDVTPVLLRLKEVCRLLGVSRSTVYQWIARDAFPRPVKVSERSVRWRSQDIEAWSSAIDQRNSL